MIEPSRINFFAFSRKWRFIIIIIIIIIIAVVVVVVIAAAAAAAAAVVVVVISFWEELVSQLQTVSALNLLHVTL